LTVMLDSKTADAITSANDPGTRSKTGLMSPRKNQDYPGLLRIIRRQLGLSQEDLAHAIGVSFATVNRWENGQAKPSKLARAQLEIFCARMKEQGNLKLPRAVPKG
jgi:putative transcriptional regulator